MAGQQGHDLPRVGFIGLGDIGAPMARRLLRQGFPLSIWARRPETIAAFAEPEARAVADLAELGRSVDIAAICVGHDADLLDLLFTRGLIAAMRPGGALVIHSTVHPGTVSQAAEAGRARGVAVIDAPVSGGRSGAAQGTLTLMVGCEEADLALVRPMLEALGTPTRLGPVGAGQTAKILNNTLMSANIGLAADAMACAADLGLDPAAFAQILARSSGNSAGLGILMARLAEFRAGGNPLRPAILAKDVGHFGAIHLPGHGADRLDAAARQGVAALTHLFAPANGPPAA
ncbi:NAD(P)-dependent oxidoreductase [Novosphingobium bradum]|uniref:NAD(P)-dependent oxidoreductase n=1 Tax=Novosphingobium bradum TaxID=1737444 RepID=A0ABV7IV19_9SPHN